MRPYGLKKKKDYFLVTRCLNYSFEKRYTEHGSLCIDFSYLDSKHFQDYSDQWSSTFLILDLLFLPYIFCDPC
jgi:hypothetical protein